MRWLFILTLFFALASTAHGKDCIVVSTPLTIEDALVGFHQTIQDGDLEAIPSLIPQKYSAQFKQLVSGLKHVRTEKIRFIADLKSAYGIDVPMKELFGDDEEEVREELRELRELKLVSMQWERDHYNLSLSTGCANSKPCTEDWTTWRAYQEDGIWKLAPEEMIRFLESDTFQRIAEKQIHVARVYRATAEEVRKGHYGSAATAIEFVRSQYFSDAHP